MKHLKQLLSYIKGIIESKRKYNARIQELMNEHEEQHLGI